MLHVFFARPDKLDRLADRFGDDDRLSAGSADDKII
jgi:hypothetical protein